MAGKLLMFSDARTDCVFNNTQKINSLFLSLGLVHTVCVTDVTLILIGN